MTPQEMQALETFLAQLTQARAGAKDPQADALIAEAVARQPDAAYLLVQRALLLDHALTAAKTQVTTLQSQLQAAQAGGSNAFLDPANTWGNPANRAAPSPGYAPAAAAPAPMAAPAQPAQPARSGFLSSGFGSALGGIATTAAGVAGGALLFQGIENLFHHNSGGGFLGGQPVMGSGSSETVINNYYESAGDRSIDTDTDTTLRDDSAVNTDTTSSDDNQLDISSGLDDFIDDNSSQI